MPPSWCASPSAIQMTKAQRNYSGLANFSQLRCKAPCVSQRNAIHSSRRPSFYLKLGVNGGMLDCQRVPLDWREKLGLHLFPVPGFSEWRTLDCQKGPLKLAGGVRRPCGSKSWQTGPLKLQVLFLFAFFFGAREDQPVLLRSRAICRLSRIFSEILQDRHRPPSDLADGLMRNSSSGQNHNGYEMKPRKVKRGNTVYEMQARTKTANPMHGGGITLAVLCRDLCPALDLHGPTF
jgi:hypothetical protein